MNILKHWIAVAAFVFALLGTGCNYTIGNLGHPQLKSIAVAPAKNETTEAHVATWIREDTAGAFDSDGTFKLRAMESADCILYLRAVNSYSSNLSQISTNANYRRRPYAATLYLTVEYTLIVPGKIEPVRSGSVIGTAVYEPFIDAETSRVAGVRAASEDAAKQIMTTLTQAW